MIMDKTKMWLIGGVIGVVVLGAGAGVFWVFQGDEKELPPTPDTENPESLVEVLADKRFKNLDQETQQTYMQQFRDAGTREQRRELTAKLSESQQQQLRNNMRQSFRQQREKEMNERMDAYFALPPDGSERTAYLDKMIDDMEARRAQWQRERQANPPSAEEQKRREERRAEREKEGGDSGRRRRFSPGRMKTHIESEDPAESAKRMEFFKAMRERMEARGIKMRGPRGPR